MKRKYFDVVIMICLCVLFIWRFVFYQENVASQNNISEVVTVAMEENISQTEEVSLSQEEETTQNDTLSSYLKNTEPEDIWDKIMKNYISSLSSMIDVNHMKGAYVKSYKEEVRQDDWIYQIQGAYITKQKDKSWDFVPDSSRYVYDKENNLINDYSYVVIKIKIKKVAKVMIGELYLNSMWLCIYNEEGEKVDGAEAATAALNKPDIGSYFACPLEVGEELETEVVYIMQDCYLLNENYYILDINNTGVTPFKAKDFSFVSIPLGQGVEDTTVSSQPDSSVSEDIWDKIAEDYLLSLGESVNWENWKEFRVKNDKEEVRQDDWIYQIQGGYITKQVNESWDFVPDGSEFVYDKENNLINDYSYVVIKIKIKRVTEEKENEVFLNSMILRIYNEQGEKLTSDRTRTAALNKPHIGSYFACPLEIGEEVETEMVYVIQDCYLLDTNYYMLQINNRGVTPFEADDISFVRIPLGQGAKDEEADRNGM